MVEEHGQGLGGRQNNLPVHTQHLREDTPQSERGCISYLMQGNKLPQMQWIKLIVYVSRFLWVRNSGAV